MSDQKTLLITALCPILLEDGRSLGELQPAEVPETEARDLLARGFAEAGDARAEGEREAEAAPAVGGRRPKPTREGAPS